MNRALKKFFVLVTLCLIFTIVTNLKASTHSFKPVPLSNQSLMFESTGSGIKKIEFEASQKRLSSIEKKSLSKSIYRKHLWNFEGTHYDIPIRYTPKVSRIIRRLTTKQRKKIMKGIRRSGRYVTMITRMLEEEGMPLDLLYMVPAESNFSVHSVSKKSAVGLWQFISSTGRRYGLKINRWIDERRDPILSTKAAITYLKHLYGIFGDWELAMAAYNTGEGRVQRAIKLAKRKGRKTDYSSLRLPRETRNYVPAIMAMAIIFKNPDRYGFGRVHSFFPMDETKANLSVAFSLEEVAKRSKISFKLLREKNPALFLGLPPMIQKGYSFYLPKKFHRNLMFSLSKNPIPSKKWGLSYNALLSNSKHVTRVLQKFGAPIYFKVQKGDNLWDLSRKHKTSISRLSKWNKLNSRSILRVNKRMKTYVPTWRVFKEIAKNNLFSRPKLIAQRIRVPKGGVLSKIAKRYRTSVKKLMYWNKIPKPNKLREGQNLIVGYRKITNTVLSKSVNVIRVPKNVTLSHLALKYKTTVKKLMSWNGLSNTKHLRAGMKFYVKQPPRGLIKSKKIYLANANLKKNNSGIRHRIIRVRSGDTLWGIAKLYRTTVKTLLTLNELKSSKNLRTNQKLIVPFRS